MDSFISERLLAFENGSLSTPEIRTLATELGRVPVSAEIEAVLQHLMESEDDIVRYNAIGSAGLDLGITRFASQFHSIALNDSDPDCRDVSVSILGSLFAGTRDKQALITLSQVVANDQDESIRRSAYRAMLFVVGVPPAKQLELLQNRDIHIDHERIRRMLSDQ